MPHQVSYLWIENSRYYKILNQLGIILLASYDGLMVKITLKSRVPMAVVMVRDMDVEM